MTEDIKNWISKLDIPQLSIGGNKVCPYARTATYELVEINLHEISVTVKDVDLIIYKVEDDITLEELTSACKNLNNIQKELVFLPDHKNRHTYIKDVQTNNGKYNLVLCQKREKLEKARTSLRKTDYYSYWNKEYLEEILGE